GWELYVAEDKFTGNKACEVYTKFRRAEESGELIRTLTIPFDGVRLNQSGEFWPQSYEVKVLPGLVVDSGLQMLIDSQRVSLDSERESTIESMRSGKHLQIRYTYSAFGSSIQEQQSLTLEGFSSVWQ